MREYSVTRAALAHLCECACLRSAVAVTGGCLSLTELRRRNLSRVTNHLTGFGGAVIIGSGRVLDAWGRPVSTIMEVGPELRAVSKETTVLGLRPETMVCHSDSFITVTHPDSVPTLTFDGYGWVNEAYERIAILDGLRRLGWETSLVVYHGGPLALTEMRLAERHGHRVVTLADSSHFLSRKEVTHETAHSCRA